MDYFSITGGKALKGSVELSGAKNAASKMMIVSLLTEDEVILTNVPRQEESFITEEIIHSVGGKTSWEDHTLTLQTKEILKTEVLSQTRKNRISILSLAPLLHRTGEGFVPVVGGDQIGPRPVNWHLETLQKMGAVVVQKQIGKAHV